MKTISTILAVIAFLAVLGTGCEKREGQQAPSSAPTTTPSTAPSSTAGGK